MWPYLVTWHGIGLPAYPVLYGCAIGAGGIVVLRLGHCSGLSTKKLGHLVLLISIAVLLGGRLAFRLQHPEEFSANGAEFFDFAQGGQVFYGGLLLSVPVAFLGVVVLRLPVAQTLDILTVSTPLGLAIGRLGCLCRGCCYGQETNAVWAIQYPRHFDLEGNIVGSPVFVEHLNAGLIRAVAECSLPVHPAPIYASLLSIGVFIVMLRLWKTGQFEGRLVLVYLVMYGACRFALDFFREYKEAFWGLTVSQVVSVFIVVAGLFVFAMTKSRVSTKSGA